MECPICLEILNDSDTIVTKCNHKFHKECLFEWNKRSNICPYCRTLIITTFNGKIVKNRWLNINRYQVLSIDDVGIYISKQNKKKYIVDLNKIKTIKVNQKKLELTINIKGNLIKKYIELENSMNVMPFFNLLKKTLILNSEY